MRDLELPCSKLKHRFSSENCENMLRVRQDALCYSSWKSCFLVSRTVERRNKYIFTVFMSAS